MGPHILTRDNTVAANTHTNLYIAFALLEVHTAAGGEHYRALPLYQRSPAHGKKNLEWFIRIVTHRR